MRTSYIVVLFTILFTTGVHGQGVDTLRVRADLEPKFRELVTRTNFDPVSTMPLYLKSDATSSVNNQTIVRGWSQLDAVTKASAGTQGSYFMKVGSIDVTPLGADNALVVAPFTMQVRNGTDFVDLTGSMSLVYQRVSGDWQLLHEHYSLGADPNALLKLNEQIKTLQAQLSAPAARQSPAVAKTQGDLVTSLAKMFLAANGGGSATLALQLAQWLLASPAKR